MPTSLLSERVDLELIENGGDAIDRLTAIRQAKRSLEQAERVVVRAARRERYSWQAIGDALGVSRQAVRKRFPDLD